MRHSEVQNILYDYLQDDLEAGQKEAVEQHLASCKACAADLKVLQQAVTLLPRPPAEPEDEKDDAFWQSLALRVEREINRRPSRVKPLAGFMDGVRRFIAYRPALTYAGAGSLATILIAVVVFRLMPQGDHGVAGNGLSAADSSFILADYQTQQRIHQYFRKSKTLLVGIANMKTDDEENVDMSAERRLSRNLVHEARYLKQQPMDDRSAKLVGDLEKILIELANLEHDKDRPNVELIRSGIHQENLLFKIRMAEASYDTNKVY